MDLPWADCLFLESFRVDACPVHDHSHLLGVFPAACRDKAKFAAENMAGLMFGANRADTTFLVPNDAVSRTLCCIGRFLYLMSKQKVLAIVGPTCTGKTALAIKLAQQFDGEIICADSRTVYRYFDIGTAKATEAERQGVPHHLLDVVDPDENFTASRFTEMASAAIAEIAARDRLPIVCGGTGFYSRALLEGLSIPAVAPQEELRRELSEEADLHGNEHLYKRLAQLDPETALRLSPNDRFRVIRALEVCLTTGQRFSELAGHVEKPYQTCWIGLSVKDRDKLRVLIEKRLKEQMSTGMLDEVKRLLEKYGASQKILNTVNYKDLVDHLQGRLKLEQAVQSAERHNYQLARRQMMWFKTNPDIQWFLTDEISQQQIFEDVCKIVDSFLTQQ